MHLTVAPAFWSRQMVQARSIQLVTVASQYLAIDYKSKTVGELQIRYTEVGTYIPIREAGARIDGLVPGSKLRGLWHAEKEVPTGTTVIPARGWSIWGRILGP